MFFFRYCFYAHLFPGSIPNYTALDNMPATAKLSAKYTQYNVFAFALLTQSMSAGLIDQDTMNAILRDHLAFFGTPDEQTAVFDRFSDKDFVKNVQMNIKTFLQAYALDTANSDIVSRIVASAAVPCVDDAMMDPADYAADYAKKSKKPRATRAKKSAVDTAADPLPNKKSARTKKVTIADAPADSEAPADYVADVPVVQKPKKSRKKDAIAAEPKDAIAEPKDAIAEPKDAIAEPKDAIAAEPKDAIAEPKDAIAAKKEKKPRTKKTIEKTIVDSEPDKKVVERVPTPILPDCDCDVDHVVVVEEEPEPEPELECETIENVMQTIEFDGCEYLLDSDHVRVFSNTDSGELRHVGNLVDDSIEFL